jgi:ribosomal protein S19
LVISKKIVPDFLGGTFRIHKNKQKDRVEITGDSQKFLRYQIP